MRKVLIVAGLSALSVSLLFFVFAFFVPALDRVLLWPGFQASRALGISAESATATYAALGIAVAWMFWAAILAAVTTLIKKILWQRRELFVASALIVCAILFFEVRGKHGEEYDGTWERGFERSDFYYGGRCWRLPYWLTPTSELVGRVDALGNPPAVRVKFVGDTTSIGPHGHLGGYLREIRVLRTIEVKAAQTCRE